MSREINALVVQKSPYSVKKYWRKDKFDRKMAAKDKAKSHTKDQCFKLIGYPDWYNPKKSSTVGSSKTGKMAANAFIDGNDYEDNPLDSNAAGSSYGGNCVWQFIIWRYCRFCYDADNYSWSHEKPERNQVQESSSGGSFAHSARVYKGIAGESSSSHNYAYCSGTSSSSSTNPSL